MARRIVTVGLLGLMGVSTWAQDCHLVDPKTIAALPGGPWSLFLLTAEHCRFEGSKGAYLYIDLRLHTSTKDAQQDFRREERALVNPPSFIEKLGNRASYGALNDKPQVYKVVGWFGKLFVEVGVDRSNETELSTTVDREPLAAITRSAFAQGEAHVQEFIAHGGYCPITDASMLPSIKGLLNSKVVVAEWLGVQGCRYGVPDRVGSLDISVGSLDKVQVGLHEHAKQAFFANFSTSCKKPSGHPPADTTSWSCRDLMGNPNLAWVAGDKWYSLRYSLESPGADDADREGTERKMQELRAKLLARTSVPAPAAH
ncbi:hypothetical protein [Chitinimonas lacunae]|uniref:DUF1176 domain-containing protein n=1 Tax=Chitinimonas lacunae TaxID=1963018 RepID=A0ABV8MLM1_9NEIS